MISSYLKSVKISELVTKKGLSSKKSNALMIPPAVSSGSVSIENVIDTLFSYLVVTKSIICS